MLAFTLESGEVALCQKTTSIPDGLPWIVVSEDELPEEKYRHLWKVSGNTVIVDDEPLQAELLEEHIEDVNREAFTRILRVFGATSRNYVEKEMNALMAAIVLQEIPLEERTEEEKAKVSKLVNLGVLVKNIRDVSNKAIIDKTALEDIVWD
jgi:hypothetical protein